MQGQYAVLRKVKDLEEGYEFRPNRFIADKNNKGCYVTYRSQEGDLRYLWNKSSRTWMDSEFEVDCMVDFVPDALRADWGQLQKLGKCFLEYNPEWDCWIVRYPENPTIFNTECWGNGQTGAIQEAMFDIVNRSIIHNGHRWFDCRDVTNFKKISDDEAKKLLDELAG